MRRLTESAVGLWLVALSLICAAVGIADNLAAFSEPATWFLTGLVLAILAIAVAVDEQRLSNLPPRRPAEEWLGRSIVGLSLLCAAAGFVLGVFLDDGTRDLWSVMAVILALLAVSVTIDADRVTKARDQLIDLRHDRDALAGVVCAALAFGVGVFGLFTGLFGLPHAAAWLFAGVVFGVVSTAFMFDEQAQVIHRSRGRRHTPFRAPPR